MPVKEEERAKLAFTGISDYSNSNEYHRGEIIRHLFSKERLIKFLVNIYIDKL